MTIQVQVQPITEYDPNQLGNELYAIVQDPETRARLKVDFPILLKLYKSPKRAREVIKQRQASMRQGPDYKVLAISLGLTPDSLRTCGLISFLPSDIPGTGYHMGLNVAVWLSARREKALRGVMAQVAAQAAQIIAEHKYNTDTKLWTLARPDHPASIALLEQPWFGLTFKKEGPVQSYKRVDGVRKHRQLFTSNTLADLQVA